MAEISFLGTFKFAELYASHLANYGEDKNCHYRIEYNVGNRWVQSMLY